MTERSLAGQPARALPETMHDGNVERERRADHRRGYPARRSERHVRFAEGAT
ncbi:hypothetical protein LS637_004216 [Salmonella enterica]|nr:hypothetical protein [Salmonella enterica]